VDPTALSIGITGYKIVNDTSFQIGDYEALKEAAVEPYNALRNAYIQYRQKKVAE
jgi:phospholipid-binding lipoprotein MlaA